MPPFNSILVDVDALAAAHPALDRAIELARMCGARLKIVDSVHIPPAARRSLPRSGEETLVGSRRDRLASFARAATGVDAEFDVLRGRPGIALVQEVLRSGHDLLMRSHARDLAARPPSFGAVDMQLFRQCPCPVWAVGPGATAAPRRILAAVHANPDDRDEQRLNGKIIDLAASLAALQNASVVLFQAWTAFGEELLRSRHSPGDLDAYIEAAEEAATSALESLAASLGDRAPQVRLELRKGHPEEVIPEYVVSEGIDLVVMGTVARTGITGLVIGNTAERLLQRLVSSVIAVKPDGFVSSIRADDG